MLSSVFLKAGGVKIKSNFSVAGRELHIKATCWPQVWMETLWNLLVSGFGTRN